MIIKNDPATIQPYLVDASNFAGGSCSSVVIPESKEELVSFLKSNTEPLTFSGARTGLTGSAVPLSGSVVSLEKLNKFELSQEGEITAGPAVRLKEIVDYLKGSDWFYPPNPTEALASLGGTVATNASGSRSYKWGATREYVMELEIVLADGKTTRLFRGHTIDQPLVFDDGSSVHFPEIHFESPTCKNAAGYYIQPGMDWMDLFIGSEGTLALFTEIKIKLIPAPSNFLSAILFFESEEDSWKLTENIRSSVDNAISPCAIEYFDQFSLLRLKPEFPNIPEKAQAALFFEQDISRPEEETQVLEAWYEFLESHHVDLDSSWFAGSDKDLTLFHDFRHKIPLLLNEENSRKGRTKMGTDMAVSDSHFLDLMSFYKAQLAESGVHYAMFGHIGDNHIHINLLPEKNEMEKAKATYMKFVERVLDWGGTVSAEHGIGKLKKDYYQRMVGPQAIAELKSIKALLDSKGILGQGNLF